MNSYETFATVADQGEVHVTGVPFAPGTKVEVIINPWARSGDDLPAARARMRELFATIKGFRMAPKLRREELYERGSLR